MGVRKLNVLDRYGNTFPLILADMKRYNNRVKIKTESIAEHSFFVAYNILKIGYDYRIDEKIVNDAVSLAIAHDYPEAFTSDLPHDCKQSHPELRKMLEKIELEFIKEEMPELYERYDRLLKGNTLASLLVDIGDAISVLQYSNREIALGNATNDFKIIHNECCARVTKLFEKLEEELANDNEKV